MPAVPQRLRKFTLTTDSGATLFCAGFESEAALRQALRQVPPEPPPPAPAAPTPKHMPRVLPYDKRIGGRTVYGFEAEYQSEAERNEAMARVLNGESHESLNWPSHDTSAETLSETVEARAPGRPSLGARIIQAMDALADRLDACKSIADMTRLVLRHLETHPDGEPLPAERTVRAWVTALRRPGRQKLRRLAAEV